ncbi:MAG: DUF2141 domain-containing protein [Alphaproteobacteria bacterium GM202ARS2]|nr:DUF2141 domain-containing protein [Alphaproteobacteria bacterium GM202ARS2]
MKRWLWITCLLLTCMLEAGVAQAADLRILVEGLVNQRGVVRIALFTQPDQFPSGDAVRRINVETPIAAKKGIIVTNLPRGTYAIAVFHDADGDDVFARNFLGIPIESYGFSRNAEPGWFSAPEFDDAAFRLSENARRKMTIRMQTW